MTNQNKISTPTSIIIAAILIIGGYIGYTEYKIYQAEKIIETHIKNLPKVYFPSSTNIINKPPDSYTAQEKSEFYSKQADTYLEEIPKLETLQ